MTLESEEAPSGAPQRSPSRTWILPARSSEGLAQYLSVVREAWWLVALTLVAALGAAALYLSRAEPVYEAQADILVEPLGRDTFEGLGLGLIRESSDPTRDVETVSRLVTTSGVARRVITRLKLQKRPRDVLKKVSAEPVAQSNIVSVTAEADSAKGAAALANRFAEEFVGARTDALHKRLGDILPSLSATARQRPVDDPQRALVAQLEIYAKQDDPTVRVETPAEVPQNQVSPRPVLTIAAALLGGTILGIAAAFLLQLLSPRLRREEQLRDRFRLPVIGRVPIERGRRRGRALLPTELSLGTLDAYQSLRASLSTRRREALASHVILITSPSPGDGKTTAAINLASAVAAAGKKVILVEADLRRPAIGKALGLRAEAGKGLASVVSRRTYMVDALIPVGDENSNLSVLLSSPDEESPNDLLARTNVDTLLLTAKRLARWVIIDSPPLNHFAETLALARQVDDVLLVVRVGKSNLTDLGELGEMLAQQDIEPTGFVIVGGTGRTGYY